MSLVSIQQSTNMEMMAIDYVGMVVTTGLSAYLLAKLLSGGSGDCQLYGGMTTALAVGVATGIGSIVAKVGHEYVIPHIPQADRWKTIESASLNAGMAGAGSLGYVALMDSDVAKADTVPSLVMPSVVRLLVTTYMTASSSHCGGDLHTRYKDLSRHCLGGSYKV